MVKDLFCFQYVNELRGQMYGVFFNTHKKKVKYFLFT